VQRLYFMFPPGWPGIGLLFMRSSVAIALLVEGYCRRQGLPVWMQAAGILLSITMFAGCMTPIAAAIGLLCHGLIWFRVGINAAAAIIVSLDIVALILLGPGAYSIDAYRYGRRVLMPPP
jgi:hypothetical protein